MNTINNIHLTQANSNLKCKFKKLSKKYDQLFVQHKDLQMHYKDRQTDINELKRQIKTENIENKNELISFMDRFIKNNNKKGYSEYFEKSYKLLRV